MSETYYHLKAIDYPTRFPSTIDAFPVMLDKHTYIDDWVFNRLYSQLAAVQAYLITNKVMIER